MTWWGFEPGEEADDLIALVMELDSEWLNHVAREREKARQKRGR